MSEDNKLKLLVEELKMIQDIIKRMANNSFKLKQWCVTIVVVTMIFRAPVDSCIIPLIPLIAFGILDAYYLTLERRFRKLYDKKVQNFHKERILNEIFTFQINESKADLWDTVKSICDTAKSTSIWLFYGCIFILVLIATK